MGGSFAWIRGPPKRESIMAKPIDGWPVIQVRPPEDGSTQTRLHVTVARTVAGGAIRTGSPFTNMMWRPHDGQTDLLYTYVARWLYL
jgi:hypothetical protein